LRVKVGRLVVGHEARTTRGANIRLSRRA